MRDNMMDDDPLAPAIGLVNGVGLGLLLWIIVGAVWWAMAGCTAGQRQAASDGRAGVAAVRMETGKYPVLGAKLDPILRGIDSNLCAAAGTEAARLPLPRMAPEAILADGEKYAEQAKALESENTRRWYTKLAIVAGSLLSMLIAAKLAPTAPVVALLNRVPVVGGMLGGLYSFWALTRKEAAEKARQEAQPVVYSASVHPVPPPSGGPT